MRVCLVLGISLLLLAGCLSAAPTTPTPDVVALQTQAAALHEVATAQAQVVNAFPSHPPADETAFALGMALLDAASDELRADNPATIAVLSTREATIFATLTALPIPTTSPSP